MEMSRKSKERNFTEKINAPILLEAVLAIVAMPEPWSNLEKKDNSSVLKDNFHQEKSTLFHINRTRVIQKIK